MKCLLGVLTLVVVVLIMAGCEDETASDATDDSTSEKYSTDEIYRRAYEEGWLGLEPLEPLEPIAPIAPPPNDVEGRKLPLSQGLMTVLGSLAGLFVIYLTVSAIVHARRSARR